MSLLLALLAQLALASSDERQRYAEDNFDALMQLNAMEPARGSAAAAPVEPAPALQSPSSGSVQVGLSRYEALMAELRRKEAAQSRRYDALVVLGAAHYAGKAESGGLRLRLRVQATLLGEGLYKVVPLVGEEVAVLSARRGAERLPLSVQSGYQVWVTDEAGEVELELEILVPARGPRGSLEYDFLVPRTPVTTFACDFAEPGLEPRLDRAVSSVQEPLGSGLRLRAVLEPSARVHLVGYKAVEGEEAQPARVYAESRNIASVEGSHVDLFTEIRYDILQSGTRSFELLVPPGWAVLSAEGQGAFRYQLEAAGAEGTLLKGETAWPIRDHYALSLRLRRALEPGQGSFQLEPPRARGIEREVGWIGVEVLGNLQLEERGRQRAIDVDVGLLPAELSQGAVSPLLRGYRYHESGPSIELVATPLMEVEPASGSVDRVEALTVVAPEGRTFTRLSLTLRNRLRHSLRLQPPPGAELRAARLDGEAIHPSTDAAGALLLPLKRSAGGDRLQPFTIELLLESEGPGFWPLGLRSYALPTVELPVSELFWELSLPANNAYSGLVGGVEPQSFRGVADWYGSGGATLNRAPSTLELPRGGESLYYRQYWLNPGQPFTLWGLHLRRWLRLPLGLLSLGGVVVLLHGLIPRWSALDWRRRAPWLFGLALGLLLAQQLVSTGWFLAAGWVLKVWLGARLGLAERLRSTWTDLRSQSPSEGPPRPGTWRSLSLPGRLLLGLGLVGLLFLASLLLLRLFVLAQSPLPG